MRIYLREYGQKALKISLLLTISFTFGYKKKQKESQKRLKQSILLPISFYFGFKKTKDSGGGGIFGHRQGDFDVTDEEDIKWFFDCHEMLPPLRAYKEAETP